MQTIQLLLIRKIKVFIIFRGEYSYYNVTLRCAGGIGQGHQMHA